MLVHVGGAHLAVGVAHGHDVLDFALALAHEGAQVLDVHARVRPLLQLQAAFLKHANPSYEVTNTPKMF